jgi:LexA-binding, inner membrane-associated putative hydrolase
LLGRDHALSGALVFAALGPSLHVTGSHLAAGVVIAAGAGVLPDLDHPDSSIAQSFGFLTEAFAWVVNRISGGHRHGTHALIGITVFTAGAVAAGWYQQSGRLIGHTAFSWHMVPAALYLALLYSAALRALHIGGHHGDLPGIGGVVLPRPLQIITAKMGENRIIFAILTGALALAVWHATGHPM